jgi:hypothetical protein
VFVASALALLHCSNGLWVTPSTVRFVWQIQPSNGTAGMPWADQPKLRLVRRSEGVDDGQPYTLISLGTWYADGLGRIALTLVTKSAVVVWPLPLDLRLVSSAGLKR